MKDPIAQLAQHFTEQQLLTAIIVIIISIIVTMIVLRFNRQTVLGKLVDPMIGQTVIHFVTHGCMGTEHEFNYNIKDAYEQLVNNIQWHNSISMLRG